jgi:multimeric flavodoxin WrbA
VSKKNNDILAIYGSPRKDGNTALLLRQAVEGARSSGAKVEEIYLRDMEMSPCLEDYGCLASGRCVIRDDFQGIYDLLFSCRGIMLASPVFFCAVSAHTKILMDRCQCFWVRKNLLGKSLEAGSGEGRKGLFISVAARKSSRNFDGALISVRHFFEALDVELWKSLLFPGVDKPGEIQSHPDALEKCRATGAELGRFLCSGSGVDSADSS